MQSGIQQHGTLEQFVKDEARRWGYEVEFSNQDIDPLAGTLTPKPDWGRGDVVLVKGTDSTQFEYKLPEEREGEE